MLKNNEFLEADNFSAYTVAGKLEKMKNYVITNAIQGPQGPRGPQGVQGVQGDTGPQGEQGEKGVQGIQGIQGVKGDAGPQGEQGEQGEKGVQGIQGIQGVQGDAGPQGEQGEQGVQGIQGIQGVQGDAGQQGERGPQGEQGVQGPQGIQGETGQQGIQGSQGPQGPQGSKGDKGVSGNDFTIQGTVSSTVSLPNDLTVADVGVAYFVGTSIPRSIFSWGYLESGLLGWVNQGTLQGPQGEQGVQGPQGIQGETGLQGIQGEQGPQGEQGVQGVKGDKGEQGPQGIQGVQGEQGPQGEDSILFTDVSRPLILESNVDLTSGDLFNIGYIKNITLSYTASGTDSDINELAGKYYFAYLGKADNSVNSVALFGKFGVNNFGTIYSSVANGGFKNYSNNYETDLLVNITVSTIINSKISVTLYSKKALSNITSTINNIIIRGF